MWVKLQNLITLNLKVLYFRMANLKNTAYIDMK